MAQTPRAPAPVTLADEPARLQVVRLDDSAAWAALAHGEGRDAWTLEEGLARTHPQGEFTVPGHCWVDNAQVEFRMDYLYAFDYDGRAFPNWRERMTCPACGMNNRHRAMVHLAAETLLLDRTSRIYLSEQLSPIYRAMSARYPLLVGSEFLGPEAVRGSVNARGIRHEDITRLTFADASLDAVLTFDVLEHVPDYRRALAECARVLVPGGAIMLSVPFMENAEATRVRATVAPDGTLTHHHPPSHHGDPVRPGEGVLCFQEFGWDILESLREAGFADATALAYRSPHYGYLGGWPLVFVAWKPGVAASAKDADPVARRESIVHAPQVGEYAWHAFTGDEDVERESRAHFEEIGRLLSKHRMARQGARMLEVGAYRHFTGDLAMQEWEMDVTLTDIAASSLREGRRQARSAGVQARPILLAADFLDLPLADEQFDVVFVSSSVHHTWQPERVIREMLRVLRPGGLLILNNEPCARLACLYQFRSNRPELRTPFEAQLERLGLLTWTSSPFPGSRAEDVFGMTENDRIPASLYRDEFRAQGEILEWEFTMHGLDGEHERAVIRLPGQGPVFIEAITRYLREAFEPARAAFGETDRLLGFSFPTESQLRDLAERIAPGVEALRMAGADPAFQRAELFGAALRAVVRKSGATNAKRVALQRWRRRLIARDGVWEEDPLNRGVASLLGQPALPHAYLPENHPRLERWFAGTEWVPERELAGQMSLLNRGADASIVLDAECAGVFVLRFYAVVAEGRAFEVRLLADDTLLDRQVMVLSESRLSRGWVPAGTRRMHIALRNLDGSPREQAGAIRVGVAQFLPVDER